MIRLPCRFTDQTDSCCTGFTAEGTMLGKQNLTKKAIEAAEATGGKRASILDSRVPGLGVLIQPTGHKAFFWYRKVNGRPVWKTLGDFPALTIEQARTRAQELNAQSGHWKAHDFEASENPFEKRRDLTLGEVLNDYIDRHLKSRAKNPDRAAKGARWQFEKYLDGWKGKRLGSITRRDVLTLYDHTRKKVGMFTANRTAQLLRALFNWASHEMSYTGENPARIKLVSERDKARSRFLQPDELVSLFRALRTEPSRDLQGFVVLALFTGARAGDILSMRWEQLSMETTTWTIPNPKSRTPYVVPLLPEAVEIVVERQQRRKHDSPWVFPGSGRTGHITGFKRSWPALLDRAKLKDFRVHDLRRTLGSWMAGSGASLPVIGKALGHQSLGATAIYARLQLDPVREAMQRATQAMLNGKA